MENHKIILRNDVKKKKRQQINISVDKKLHLDVKELHVIELQKGNKLNLSEFYEMIIAKGVREWRNQ